MCVCFVHSFIIFFLLISDYIKQESSYFSLKFQFQHFSNSVDVIDIRNQSACANTEKKRDQILILK